jgi:hypothetical protein
MSTDLSVNCGCGVGIVGVVIVVKSAIFQPSFGSVIAVAGTLFWKKQVAGPSSDKACFLVS